MDFNILKILYSIVFLGESIRAFIYHSYTWGLINVAVSIGIFLKFDLFRKIGILIFLIWMLMLIGLFFPFLIDNGESVFLPNLVGSWRLALFIFFEALLICFIYFLQKRKDDKSNQGPHNKTRGQPADFQVRNNV